MGKWAGCAANKEGLLKVLHFDHYFVCCRNERVSSDESTGLPSIQIPLLAACFSSRLPQAFERLLKNELMCNTYIKYVIQNINTGRVLRGGEFRMPQRTGGTTLRLQLAGWEPSSEIRHEFSSDDYTTSHSKCLFKYVTGGSLGVQSTDARRNPSSCSSAGAERSRSSLAWFELIGRATAYLHE